MAEESVKIEGDYWIAVRNNDVAQVKNASCC